MQKGSNVAFQYARAEPMDAEPDSPQYALTLNPDELRAQPASIDESLITKQQNLSPTCFWNGRQMMIKPTPLVTGSE